jgi:formate hydrogenlyase subunit 4
LLGVFYLLAKAFIIYYVIMWVRYSFPRLRIDQMLGFSWKFLTPLALVLLIVTAILDKLLVGTFQVQPATPIYAISMLVANVLIALVTVQVLRSYGQLRRQRFADDRPVAVAPEADFKELVAQE